MVGGKGGDGGEAADRGEGADAKRGGRVNAYGAGWPCSCWPGNVSYCLRSHSNDHTKF